MPSLPAARPALARLLALLLLLLVGAATTTRAQQATPPPECSQDEKFANQWYFGYKAGLDFNSASADSLPKVLTNGQMTAPAGSGVVADGQGNLLFYSNGDTVWSRNHSVMMNGTGLGGSPLTTDGPLAIKRPVDLATANPNDPVHYIIFTQDARAGARGLSYSEIVVPMGMQGQVLTTVKNKHLAYGTAEKMTGVFDNTGCGIWVIVHGYGNAKSGHDNRGDSFLAYHVTTAGVDTVAGPVISTLGVVHAASTGPQSYRGQMKVTPDGKRLAVAVYGLNVAPTDSTGTVEVFNFDNKSTAGKVSNRKLVDRGAGRYYGVEFSPGKTYLYATVDSAAQLLQYDLVKDTANIRGSRQIIPLKQKQYANLGSLQAGPDGKIYVARQNQPALGFIAYPDSVGAKCHYVDDSLRLKGRRSGLGLPNFNQSSLLHTGFGAQSTACGELTFQASPPIPNPLSYAWTFKTLTGTSLGTSAEQNPKFLFPTVGTYYLVTLRITYECFCREVTSQVFVPGPPTPGTIAANQTICAGSPPAPLTSAAPAGAGTGQFSYQWQSSPDNTAWTDIQGATGPAYTPGALSTTTYYRRLVTSGFCGPRTPSASVAITVTPALTAGTIAADQTLCAGATPAALTSTADAAGGSGTITYQWESSLDNVTFAPIAGATGTTYSPGALTATTYFRRRATSGPCGPLSSNVVTILVQPALAAGSIAANQALCAGTTASPLTSTAPASGGTSSIAYQWQSSTDNATFTNINGATGATYAPGLLATTTYFRRQASASGACAPAVSNVVTITITPALTAGSIAADQALCAGTTATALTSTTDAAGGSNGVAYQWQSSADNVTFTNINGATGATYAPGLLATTTYFRRQASAGGACAPVVSNVVTITVVPALMAGSIADNQALCAGTTAAPLTSTAPASGGAGGIVYQWQSSPDNTAWTDIAGATGASYAPGALTATTYFRRLVNSGGTCAPVVSNVVVITVAPALAAGSIAADQAVCPGTTPAALTSTADASGGGGGLGYQWESSADQATWTAISGATGTTYAPGALTATTYFRRRASTASCGIVYSNVVAITVLPPVQPGSIAADQTVCAGSAPAALTSAADASGGSGTYAYQWESSADNANWTAISGATGASYAPGVLTATTYFRRRVVAGAASCQAGVSNVVAVRVQPLAPTAVTLAPPPTQCPGTALTFTAVATDAGSAPTYQWFVNGTAVASGPTFTSSTLVTGDQVRVTVTPTAGLCSTGPASATVTVTRTATPAPTLAIALQPDAPQCPGEVLTFSIASVTGAGASPSYQWLLNGNPVAGATSPVFSSTTLRDGQTVSLRLSTLDACGQPVTVVSNSITVRQLPPVQVDAGPDKLILAGTSVTLEGSVGGGATTGTWSPQVGLSYPGNDPLRPLAAPLVTTTYTLSAGAGGCANSDQVTVTVVEPIHIFNAFTPNGDGTDDTWRITNIENFENTVMIFNRWGNKVYSTINYRPGNEWDGLINGQPAAVGTYYYIVVTKGPLGRSYSGSVTVLY